MQVSDPVDERKPDRRHAGRMLVQIIGKALFADRIQFGKELIQIPLDTIPFPLVLNELCRISFIELSETGFPICSGGQRKNLTYLRNGR